MGFVIFSRFAFRTHLDPRVIGNAYGTHALTHTHVQAHTHTHTHTHKSNSTIKCKSCDLCRCSAIPSLFKGTLPMNLALEFGWAGSRDTCFSHYRQYRHRKAWSRIPLQEETHTHTRTCTNTHTHQPTHTHSVMATHVSVHLYLLILYAM